jgi:ATP-dependent DNA helicase DinG
VSPSQFKEKLIDLIFAQEGLLGRFLDAFEPRLGQKEMAQGILFAYEEDKIALIEAGTGIGKSLAYLVPAVYWALKHQEKTVISTHTIALQEQLICKDIPFLVKAMDVDLKAVLVKGMGNYLCWRKLDELRQQPLLFSLEESEQVQKVEAWLEETETGSRSEINFPLPASTWEKLACETDHCNHHKCPFYRKCFFFKARREAEDAQLLVVNHHLMMADIQAKIRQEGGEEKMVIPRFERAIIDEAHHLEQVAFDSFAQQTDRIGLQRLLGRIFSENHPERSRLTAIRSQSPHLKPTLIHQLDVEIPLLKKECSTLVEKAFAEMTHFLESVLISSKTGGKENKWRVMPAMIQMDYWRNTLHVGFHALEEKLVQLSIALNALVEELSLIKDEDLESQLLELRLLRGRLDEKAANLQRFFSDAEQEKRVRWIEITASNVMLIDASLEISALLYDHLFAKLRTTALCSATLTANRSFSYLKERLGIDREAEGNIVEQVFDSPFDYAQRTLLAIPTDLPGPSDPQFLAQIIDPIRRMIQVSRGNAFILFTSYEMLEWVYQKLQKDPSLKSYPLLKQGDLSRHHLLEQFKELSGSVLFATNSFWEGVDVPGEALRCVVIVKLPFIVPSEPIYQACSEALEKQGKDPFSHYAVPQAVIRFKQGFGRLMRKKNDRGCIVCLDHRLVKKNYGKQFLGSLPPCKTSSGPLEQVLEEMRAHYANTSTRIED